MEALPAQKRRAPDVPGRLGGTRQHGTRAVSYSNIYIKWKILSSYSSGLTLGTLNIKKIVPPKYLDSCSAGTNVLSHFGKP